MKISTQFSNKIVVCLNEIILKIKNNLIVINIVIAQKNFEIFILSKLFFLFVNESNDLIVKYLLINRNNNFKIDIDAFE